MLQSPRSRLFALLAVLSFAALACGSSNSEAETAGLTEGVETDAGGDGDAGGNGEGGDSDGSVPNADQPADPEAIRQLTSSLTGLPVEGELLTCMVEKADGDSQLTQTFTSYQTPGFQFTPEAFTALTVNVHDCVDPILLSGTLIAISGGAGDAGDFTACVARQLSDDQSGDLAYTGLAALQVRFPVPEGAQDITIDAVSDCVSNESLADQLAAAREQASGFVQEVDRDCVIEGLTPEFVDSFWRGTITSTPSSSDLEPLLEGCTSEYDSGLEKELPDDFIPFSGTGALSQIDPLARVNAYSEPPSMSLVDGVDYQAIITTGDGEILVDLYEDTAPITVMAQGGDPSNTGSAGPGYKFDDEESAMTPIDRRGLLAMANGGADDNSSQFFITFDAADWLNGKHAVFGEVIEGDDVLSQIDLRQPEAPAGRGESLVSIEIIEA